MDFGKLIIDGLIDTSTLTYAISEEVSQKIRLLAPQTILNKRPPADFHMIVANGLLETPSATVELQFEVRDIVFKECFMVKTDLKSHVWIVFSTKKQKRSRHASGSSQFLLFFLATQARRQHVFKH